MFKRFTINWKLLLALAVVVSWIVAAGDVRAKVLRVITLENGQEFIHDLAFEPETAQTYYTINELNISLFPDEAKEPLSPFAVEDKIDGTILSAAHYAATRGGDVQSVSMLDESGAKKYDILSPDGTLGALPSGRIFERSDKAGLADIIYVTLVDERSSSPASLMALKTFGIRQRDTCVSLTVYPLNTSTSSLRNAMEV